MSSFCEIPDFYEWAEPVARKQHRCCECEAPIMPGEKHFRCAGKWDGEVSSYRQHLVCMEACMWVRDHFGGECIPFGGLKEEFDEIRCDAWYPERDRYKPAWRTLRHLMATILVRERPHRTRRKKVTS